MHDETDTIKQLHLIYAGMTGHAIAFRMEHVHWWNAWRSRGWNVDDLRFHIRYLKGKIRRHERNEGALKFSNLIKDLDRFEEDHAMARSESRANERKPVSTARTRILESTGRPEKNGHDAQHVSEPVRRQWEQLKARLK